MGGKRLGDRPLRCDDHIVMPDRPAFMDDATPTIVTSRDPREYFYSLLNWYNAKADALRSGAMSVDIAHRYFDPNKVAKWVKKTNEDRLFDLINDTPDSLMVVKSRDSYDAIIQAKSKSNCYVTTFEKFAPGKNPSLFGSETVFEYVHMLGHLGIQMDVPSVKKMLGSSWGRSETYTPNGVDDWTSSLSKAMQDRIIDRFRDVYETFGYRL